MDGLQVGFAVHRSEGVEFYNTMALRKVEDRAQVLRQYIWSEEGYKGGPDQGL